MSFELSPGQKDRLAEGAQKLSERGIALIPGLLTTAQCVSLRRVFDYSPQLAPQPLLGNYLKLSGSLPELYPGSRLNRALMRRRLTRNPGLETALVAGHSFATPLPGVKVSNFSPNVVTLNQLPVRGHIGDHVDTDDMTGMVAVASVAGKGRFTYAPADQKREPSHYDTEPGDLVLLACPDLANTHGYPLQRHSVWNTGDTPRQSVVYTQHTPPGQRAQHPAAA